MGQADPFNDALRAIGVNRCAVSPDGAITLDSALAARLGVGTPCRPRDLIARCDRDFRAEFLAFARALRHPRNLDLVGHVRLLPPGAQPIVLRVVAPRGPGGAPWLALLDITEYRRAIQDTRHREAHWRRIVDYNPQCPWIADNEGHMLEVTDRWLAATMMTRELAMGDGWIALTHPDDIEQMMAEIGDLMSRGEPFDVVARMRIGDDYRWMRARAYPHRDADVITHWYGYTEDVHEQVLAEERTRWNAEHDPLTGLTNRAHFNVLLERALDQSLHRLERVGVLLIDLDHFKEVNDLHGHQTGDELLISYTARLTRALPPGATAARFGGDEFAVMIPRIGDAEALLASAQRILEIRQTLTGASSETDCRASIGASLYPEHGRNPSELLRSADIALYAAKGSGRGKSLLFEPQMQHEVRERAAMVSRARTAAASGDVLAYYQPKVSLDTGALVGFEALLRWRDSCGKINSPGSIGAAFDDPEVADMLGTAMLAHVITDLRSWTRQGLDYGTVAINVAPAELRRGGFAPRLIEALRDAGMPVGAVEVEVTEGVFLGRGADEAKRAIHQLHEAGIPLSLDDFGTGFASLSHLRALPVDAIKIDRSFISHLADADGDRAIVSAIVTLGHNLGMSVIAEGIETPAQAQALREFGCRYAQGYYFGMPTPAAGIPHLIRGWGGGIDDSIFAAKRPNWMA